MREPIGNPAETGPGETYRKIVYYGPGHSGKSENLAVLARILDLSPPLRITVPTDGTGVPEAAFESLDIPGGGRVDPFSGLQLLSVPGHHAQAPIRESLLERPDGIVFVADSRADRQDANLVSLDELGAILVEKEIPLRDLPIVLQLNRRDAADALPLATLRERLAPAGWPVVPACASTGLGVRETLAALVDLLPRRGPLDPRH